MAAPAPIPHALKPVNRLLDAYGKANGALVTPIKVTGPGGLLHVFTQRHGTPITIAHVAWQSRALNALVMRFGTPGSVERAEIYLAASLPVEWARFALCKELAHLLIDGEESFTDRPAHTAQSLIDSPLFARNGEGHPEFMYHVAAMELLMPWRRRGMLSAWRFGFMFATEKRAAHFGVPETLARYRMTGGCKRMLRRAYADLN